MLLIKLYHFFDESQNKERRNEPKQKHSTGMFGLQVEVMNSGQPIQIVAQLRRKFHANLFFNLFIHKMSTIRKPQRLITEYLPVSFQVLSSSRLSVHCRCCSRCYIWNLKRVESARDQELDRRDFSQAQGRHHSLPEDSRSRWGR